MTVLSAQTLDQIRPIDPWFGSKQIQVETGMSWGLTAAGYDIRVREDVDLEAGGFCLASSVERFSMPWDVQAVIHDKSTWARMGLSVFNTVLEPGWRGFLTLELKNQGRHLLYIPAGAPIAQAVFHLLDQPTSMPYAGKYQDQEAEPVAARFETPEKGDQP